jgi:hypothetical protein
MSYTRWEKESKSENLVVEKGIAEHHTLRLRSLGITDLRASRTGSLPRT